MLEVLLEVNAVATNVELIVKAQSIRKVSIFLSSRYTFVFETAALRVKARKIIEYYLGTDVFHFIFVAEIHVFMPGKRSKLVKMRTIFHLKILCVSRFLI